MISKDTQLCISLAGRPSNIGTRFHNFLYAELGLDFLYKACTTTDLPAAIAGVRALGIRGCSVSMPFKRDCLALVDEVDGSAGAIAAVNTIVNSAGRLTAYNTDYLAVAQLLDRHDVARSSDVAVLGSGGMARAVLAALHDRGTCAGTVIARNRATGTELAEQYGHRWQADAADARPDVIINATPVGMAGGPAADELPVPAAAVDGARLVFDVVATPVRTPLVARAQDRGLAVVTGAQVIALQAAEQFAFYTGVRPTEDQVRRASEFSRQQ